MSEIASIVWPHMQPKSWNATLRTVISKVRNSLESAGVPGESLRSRRGYVRFVPPSWVTVDLETVRDSCRATDEPAAVRADRAGVAHRLLSSPVLRGVSGTWADDVRSECDALRLQALDIDAVASGELGAFDRSLACAEASIGLDPLRERAYRIAMRGYICVGDRARALDVASRCRLALAEHLGVDPSPETEQLFLEALRQEPRSVPDEMPRFDRRLPRNSAAPVGRELQLAAFERAWEMAAGGTAQYVMVTGDAGTGKTTLVLEAIDRAQARNVDVLFGRCSEDAIIAFEPFVEAATRELDAMGVARARNWLTENGSEILRVIPDASHRFGDLVPVDAAGGAEVFTAVQRWLSAATRSNPTIIVLDDLQWASGATHALLRYLVQATASSAVCFVITARTESLDGPEVNRTLNTATRLGQVHRIALSEFTVADVRELVDARSSSLDPQELHRRTNGHPLFVTSLIADDAVGTAGTPPASILEFVRRAEHGLTDTARGLLRLCAVTGPSASHAVLRLATNDVDDVEFSDAVDELVHARMIDLAERTADITVRHPLVQEVVYAGIAPGRRAQLHSRVGHALAQWGAPVGADTSARVAFHLSRGLSADHRSAGAFAHRAADHAYALGAYEDAVAHYGHAVGNIPPHEDTPHHCTLLIGLGRARRATRDSGSRATALAALAMARRLGDRRLQIDAVLASERRGMMFVQHYDVDTERVDIVDAICSDMRRTGQDSTAEYALLLSQSVIERAWDCDHRARTEMIERAATIARDLGDGPLLARVGVATLIGVRVPHGSAVTAAALADLNNLLDARPELTRDVTITVWLSRARLEAGDLTGAVAILDAITSAHINGDPELDWLVDYGRLGIDLAAGRLVDCEKRLARIRAIPPSPTDTGYYGRLLPALTALGTLRGDLGEIVEQSALMHSRFDTNPTLRPALAVALLDLGDRDAADELVSWYTPERLDGIPVDPMWLSTLTLVARAAAELAAGPLCEQIYHRLSAHADCTVLTWASVFGVVHHHLAHLALGFGDLTRASFHIADARDAHATRGFGGWGVESEYLALRIDSEATGSTDISRVDEVRSRASALGATAVVRRLDSLIS